MPDSKTPIDLYTYDTAPFTLDDYEMAFFARDTAGFYRQTDRQKDR